MWLLLLLLDMVRVRYIQQDTSFDVEGVYNWHVRLESQQPLLWEVPGTCEVCKRACSFASDFKNYVPFPGEPLCSSHQIVPEEVGWDLVQEQLKQHSYLMYCALQPTAGRFCTRLGNVYMTQAS